MNKENKKHIAPIQWVIDASLKRQQYAIAAFAESFSTLLILVAVIFSTFHIPASESHPELLFWLRTVLSIVTAALWGTTFYKAYTSVKP